MNRIDKYKQSIRAEYKWDRIKSLAAAEGDVWLGTIFALTPSGKYYAPFACSNVMGCKRCKGTGSVVNRKADPEVFAIADARNAQLLAGLLATYGGWYRAEWPADKTAELEASRKVANDNKPTRTCEWCDGQGSHEAAKDADWWAALEQVAKSHGLLTGRLDGENEDGVWVCDGNFNNENEEVANG